MTPDGNHLRSDVLKVLDQVPEAYVRLKVAVTAPRRKRNSGVKVAGGERDFVPLNVEADTQSQKLAETVFEVHRNVSEFFGEVVVRSNVQLACEDLARWSSMWTLHPDAWDWYVDLHDALKRSLKVAGVSEEPQRLNVVCPACLQVGGMYLTDEGDYGCEKCLSSWNPEDYLRGVVEAARLLSEREAA